MTDGAVRGSPALVAERYYDAFNARDFTQMRALISPEIRYRIDGGELFGADAAMFYTERFLEQFPGMGLVDRVVAAASDETVVIEYRFRALQEFQPDQVDWQLDGLVMEVLTVQGGRITSLHSFYNSAPTDRFGSIRIPSRFEAAQIAQQQTALRRIATLVARGAPLAELLASVSEEVKAQYGVTDVQVVPLGAPGDKPSPETQPVVSAPITVEELPWGSLVIVPDPTDRVENAEFRPEISGFADLIGLALANDRNKAQLLASRARVIATADQARRQLQRDIHDTAQQRLVHTIIALKLARDVRLRDPDEAWELIEESLRHAEAANEELRDVVHGVLPAVLSTAGLRTAIESLVAEMSLKVALDVTPSRLPVELETTAYFIVAEALTNVTKHAHASTASVAVSIAGSELSIAVQDNGIGGADLQRGTGVIGMRDRVEAAEGIFELHTGPAGTVIHAHLPIHDPRE
ncbi:nuclear transport factor 2 family protein [Leifsonia virtsii]|uniref:histidine kinase n=1 Tax=Leifsonia virtsii TaxID=3035915 RepID=A0ABT8J234_9MICO|nr:nuclear transport factor 2 family protein [Leifsonia virtsii]MDN4598948.1 nuclear transport factor 2 family protein [Leifsonia virtsii]